MSKWRHKITPKKLAEKKVEEIGKENLLVEITAGRPAGYHLVKKERKRILDNRSVVVRISKSTFKSWDMTLCPEQDGFINQAAYQFKQDFTFQNPITES